MDPLRTFSSTLVAGAVLCWTVPAPAATLASHLAAMDVPAGTILDAGAVGSESQAAVLENLGPIDALRGGSMVVLTSGRAAQLRDRVDYEIAPGGTDPLEPSAPVYDQVLLEVTLQAPANAESLTFQWYFLSREYPVFVGSDFNDRFTVIQDGAEYDGNIVFDEHDNVVDINNAFFEVVDEQSLDGTGFWRPLEGGWDPFDPPAPGQQLPSHEGGATGWITTQTPVEPGETLTLRFDIHDVADAVYDSAVLIDDFQWSTTEIDDPVSGAQAQLRWLSPKSDRLEGGAHVVLEGANLRPDSEVWFGGARVDPATVVAYSGSLGVEAPASDGLGLVDVRVVSEGAEIVLHNGFMYTGRRAPELAPSLAVARPGAADPAGGTPIRILGSSFDKADVVLFGDREVEFEVVSPGEIRVVSPAHEAGPVVLRVEDAAGDVAGAPLPFVFKDGGERGRRSTVTIPGCSTASSSPVGWAFLPLLPLLGLRRRPRARSLALLASAAAALLAVGCSDTTVRSLRGGAPVARAVVLPGDAKAVEIGTGSYAVLSGELSAAEAAQGLEYAWTVLRKPVDASPSIERAAVVTGAFDDDRRVVFTPDLPGTYLVGLTLLDRRGSRSSADAVVVHVVPGRELNVELSWGTGGADLDLHVLRDDGAYFGDGDAFYGVPQPSWGLLSDPDDDPRYAGDHDGTGGTPPGESVRIPSAPDGDYTVLVHFFNDRMTGEAVDASLRVTVGGEEIVLPVGGRDVLAGEVWRAFRVAMPAGTVTPLDDLTTHDALEGPPVNGRG